MYILRIEHPVPDYDAWKASFESDPIGRERSGVRRYRVLRATDDPNYVMIDLEFDTAGEAVKAALGNVELDSASEAEAVRAALDDPQSVASDRHLFQPVSGKSVLGRSYRNGASTAQGFCSELNAQPIR